ncbi:hypothetical protein [Chitiniphilus eburneus]|uniref:hypothetical protein n=1 Tax=Chitiniphilus eburneus TaxID=2571148 RepID=UPI00145F891D|nr:hypothetical protein [Chitiniphilus eburneus]
MVTPSVLLQRVETRLGVINVGDHLVLNIGRLTNQYIEQPHDYSVPVTCEPLHCGCY